MLTASEITRATTPTTKIEVSALPTSRNGLRLSSSCDGSGRTRRSRRNTPAGPIRLAVADRRHLCGDACHLRGCARQLGVGAGGGGAVVILRVGQACGGRLHLGRVRRRQRRTTGQGELGFVGRADGQGHQVLQVSLHRGDVDAGADDEQCPAAATPADSTAAGHVGEHRHRVGVVQIAAEHLDHRAVVGLRRPTGWRCPSR